MSTKKACYIPIENLRDMRFLMMAEGAIFSGTTMPSGFKIPMAPEGQGYCPAYNEGKVVLVLKQLAPAHEGEA